MQTVEQEHIKKIFIVSDEKPLLGMYEMEFKNHGFDVTPAFGGIDAVEKLRGGIVPDVVLLDIETSILNSSELLKVIRSEKLIPNAKTVVFTTTKNATSGEESRALGINVYLSKMTVTPKETVHRVEEILARDTSLTY